MPELPEVQTVVDNLKALNIIGSTITGAKVYWPKTIAEISPTHFCTQIKGRTIGRVRRRGKYIVMHLSRNLTLMVHLRMTGRLNWTPKGKTRHKHEHVVLQINHQDELRFQDMRKFGRIWLTQTPQAILGRLGPEPLAKRFTRRCFLKKLNNKKRQIKPLLLDQSFIAGLGNIYVDEALWEACIHPRRISSSLTAKEITALHRAIPLVLHRGLKNMGTTLGSGRGNFYSVAGRPGRNADELKIFRRTGEACPRCGTMVERLVVAQRGSHICPQCQI